MSPLGESKGSWHCEKEPADRSATGSTDKAVEATILAAFSSLVPTGESPMFLWTRSATCCPYGGSSTTLLHHYINIRKLERIKVARSSRKHYPHSSSGKPPFHHSRELISKQKQTFDPSSHSNLFLFHVPPLLSPLVTN